MRNLVRQLNADGNWGKQRLCRKGSILDIAMVLYPALRDSLNILKEMKVRFWYFYCLSTKIKTITMLPSNIYKFFYLSAMLANFFGLHIVLFLETPDLALIFAKLRYFWRFTYFFFFRVKLTKSLEQSAIQKIVLASAKKRRGKRKD